MNIILIYKSKKTPTGQKVNIKKENENKKEKQKTEIPKNLQI